MGYLRRGSPCDGHLDTREGRLAPTGRRSHSRRSRASRAWLSGEATILDEALTGCISKSTAVAELSATCTEIAQQRVAADRTDSRPSARGRAETLAVWHGQTDGLGSSRAFTSARSTSIRASASRISSISVLSVRMNRAASACPQVGSDFPKIRWRVSAFCGTDTSSLKNQHPTRPRTLRDGEGLRPTRSPSHSLAEVRRPARPRQTTRTVPTRRAADLPTSRAGIPLEPISSKSMRVVRPA